MCGARTSSWTSSFRRPRAVAGGLEGRGPAWQLADTCPLQEERRVALANNMLKHVLCLLGPSPGRLVHAQVLQRGARGNDAPRVEREQLLKIAPPGVIHIERVRHLRSANASRLQMDPPPRRGVPGSLSRAKNRGASCRQMTLAASLRSTSPHAMGLTPPPCATGMYSPVFPSRSLSRATSRAPSNQRRASTGSPPATSCETARKSKSSAPPPWYIIGRCSHRIWLRPGEDRSGEVGHDLVEVLALENDGGGVRLVLTHLRVRHDVVSWSARG
eukprot:1195426-Prorocentrum_minimum.AAC.2